jgi:DNA topoisomerase IA
MFKLYRLIWQRFVASQMEAAVYDTLQVEVTGKTNEHEYLLRASGSAVKFPGFMVVYEEAKNEDAKEEEEEECKDPAGVAEGQAQELVRLDSRTAFHPAAAALFRSFTGAGAGGERHWASLHVCADHLHHPTARICRA